MCVIRRIGCFMWKHEARVLSRSSRDVLKTSWGRPESTSKGRPLNVRLRRPLYVISGRQIRTSQGRSNRIFRGRPGKLEGDVLGTSWGPIFAGWESRYCKPSHESRKRKRRWISSIISITSDDENSEKGVRKAGKEYSNMDHMNINF